MEYPRFFRLCWDNLLTLIGLNLLFLVCSVPLVTLPASLTISHAAADGYHSSLFFHQLQENLNQTETW